MCSNQYQAQRLRLIEDQRQFESVLLSIQQEQKLCAMEERYRAELREMIWNHREKQRELQLQTFLAKLEGKILLKKKQGFVGIQVYCALRNKLQAGGRKQNRKPVSQELQRLLARWERRRLTIGWKALKQNAQRKGRVPSQLFRIEMMLLRKGMVAGFTSLKRNAYECTVNSQAQVIHSLNQKLGRMEKQQNALPPPNPKLIFELQSSLRGKDLMINQLRKQVQNQRKDSEQKVQQLQDELNRLNLENMKLRAKAENPLNGTITLNDSEMDLSLRILDDIDIIPKGKTLEEELSEKYFQRIVALKETIENARQFIEDCSRDEGGISKGQVQQLLQLLRFS